MFEWIREAARSTAGYIYSSSNTSGQNYVEKYSFRPYRKQGMFFSEEAWQQIGETHSKAVTTVKDWGSLCELKKVLENSPGMSQVLSLKDGSGYNLLQHAIIANRPNIVQYLVSQGADLNAPRCGRPLHLAAKLGRLEIMKILLEYNADPLVMSCVCYPDPHIDSRNLYCRYTQMWLLQCKGDIYTPEAAQSVHFDYPLYYAVVADCVETVKLLLCKSACYCQLNIESPPIHLACAIGSFKCLQFFAETCSDDINKNDKSGLTPLQYAVKWGKAFVEYLVLKGAGVMVKTKYNETLFHLLFMEAKDFSGLSDTVKYLLDCGLQMHINAVDDSGDSPLNVLMKRIYSSDSHADDSMVQRELVLSVTYMLKASANPNIANKVGNTSLHLFSRVRPLRDSRLKTRGGDTPQPDFGLLFSLLSLLLEHRANPNLVNHSEDTVLGTFLQYSTQSMFKTLREDLIPPSADAVNSLVKCLKKLSEHGCRFNSIKFLGQSCLVHTVMAQLDVLDTIHDSARSEAECSDLATKLVSAVKSITECLLQCGFLANTCRCLQSDLHTMYYRLMSRTDIVPFESTRDFILMFLWNGTDPNVGGKHIPMSVFRYRSSHSYWPVYPLLHILNQIQGRSATYSKLDMLVLLDTFYFAMEEPHAKQCIQHYLEHDRHRSRASQCHELDLYLQELLFNPRSLKQQTAAYLYQYACERQKHKMEKLPLPKPLKTYLYNLQY